MIIFSLVNNILSIKGLKINNLNILSKIVVIVKYLNIDLFN